MIDTKFVSNICDVCGSEKITFDEHYGLPKCHDFVILCPKHPGNVDLDLSQEELEAIQEE